MAAEELFASWACGATVVLRDAEPLFSFVDLRELIEKERLTQLNLPTPYWQEWVAELVRSGVSLPTCLRHVVVGSDEVLPERWRQWRTLAGPGIRLSNAYGLTEAAVTSLIYEAPRGHPPEILSSIPIGRPVANIQACVLDRHLCPVPIGVPGELYIGGDGLARGYLNRPDLTREKFLPNPFHPDPGSRLYKTGDRARWLRDGNIEFLGRVDLQVKVRGFRIETGEVETVLARHPEVRACAVVAEEKSGNKRLVAYVVPADQPPELWPSVGEYFIYDELLYYAMTHDERRNARYRAAINRLVQDKVVLDIGTGADALLARFSAEAGAKRVYAIEMLDESYRQASILISKLGLESTITLLHGDSRKIRLPEKVDVCVSELIGTIGSSEGAAVILSEAHCFLKSDGVMIPQRCITHIAAVSLPEGLAARPRFGELAAPYAEKIFQTMGHQFDVRVCIKNFPKTNFLSHPDVFEELHFNYPTPSESDSEIQLTIERPGRLDGFLLWINLYPCAEARIDALNESTSWLPVFLPVFYPGVEVSARDIIQARRFTRLSDNGLTPNYRLEGALTTRGGAIVPFGYDSLYDNAPCGNTPFYQRLFAQDQERSEARQSAAGLDEILRKNLQEHLPAYMVPTAFVLLKELPLTPAGKIDRSALRNRTRKRPNKQKSLAPPRSEVEKTLARIWSEVLRLPAVGIHDNFFQLGGDSILGIQIIGRAKAAGLKFTPRQIFQHQTIAELALEVGTAEAITAEQGSVTGPAPLTPIQHWFLERDLSEWAQFSQSAVIEVDRETDALRVEQVLQRLELRHDALRLRFFRAGSGWQQTHAMATAQWQIWEADLSTEPKERQRAALGALASSLQAILNFRDGPLVAAALVDLGPERGRRVMLVIHHLVVDGVSWRILLEDFHTVYQQLRQNRPIQLPLKTTSFQYWAKRLFDHAQTAAVLQEVDYWLSQFNPLPGRLPIDFPHRTGPGRKPAPATVAVSLSAAETRLLLQDLPRVFRTQINDVLLTALALTFADWTGQRSILLELEGHGREPLFEEVDLSRTVGWFTSVFPVRLDVGDTGSAVETLKSVKEQLRRIPHRGIHYGLLRYCSGDRHIVNRLQALPQPEISFNYFGQLDYVTVSPASTDQAELPPDAAMNAGSAPSQERPSARASDTVNPPNKALLPQRRVQKGASDARGTASWRLDINGGVSDGQLWFTWTYNARIHRRATIEAVADRFLQALRALLAHGESETAAGASPSDFPLARLDQEQLDRLLDQKYSVEDIYPLSPMQQGMLFHSLYAPKTGEYVAQWTTGLPGDLDVPYFQRAWQEVMRRHAVLRTAIFWEGLNEPLQVVSANVALPWEELDWHELTSTEHDERLEAWLEADQRCGFNMGRAPLMRLVLIRTGEQAYRFVWSCHHLLLDGWSHALVIDELFSCYEAFCRREEPPSKPSRPFRDYVLWLQSQELAGAEKFWRKTLEGFTAPTPLLIGRSPEPGGAAARAYMCQQTGLIEAETRALQEFAQQHQLTLNTLCQGAWALLLQGCSGQDDVVFGTTVSGRSANISGIEAMVGLFINTLPVRVRLEPGKALGDWLKELQDQQVEARQFEHTPMVQVQGWSDALRGQPLFESLLVFENYPVSPSLTSPHPRPSHRPAGTPARPTRPRERSNYPLTAVVVPRETLLLRLIYDTSRFDEESMTRMLGHWRTILESFTTHEHRPLEKMTMLTEREREQIVIKWNATASPYPSSTTIHKLFEAQAERTPDAVAVEFSDQTLSYRELNQRANQLAHHLQSLGVKPGTLVGLCVERSARMIIGMLGILKVGGAYLPLDPSYPKERLAFMIGDTAAPVVLTQESLVEKLPSAPVIGLDHDWPMIAAQSKENLLGSQGNAENLAYVIYTSGSTGKPKGVAVPHRAVNRLVLNTNYLQLLASDHIAQASNACFDAATFEVWGALLHGARLVGIPNEVVLSPRAFTFQLRAKKISVLFLTTALFNQVAREAPDVFQSLRCLLFGGETCDPHTVEAVLKNGPPKRLLHVYGPTESTTFASWFLVKKVSEDPGTMPIGRALANTQLYVLDARLRPMPVGMTGELYIGGDGLAQGYYNRPELTAEKFIPNPFNHDPGARLYKTGDLVRWLPDGNLEFMGRADEQVKIRGYRVELGEIESVLAKHPAVKAAVALVPNEADKRVVAYYVPAGHPAPSGIELRQFLQQHLPDYMVPAVLIALESLPMTPGGKTDRRALPDSNRFRPDMTKVFVPPRTAEEKSLTAIWSQVLRVEQVGIADDFFALGGHSLLAMQIISRVRDLCQVELPLRSLFEHPTVEGLAKLLQTEKAPLLPAIVPQGAADPCPLSFAQQRLWFFDQLEPGHPLYIVSEIIPFSGLLDRLALQASLNEIIRRHETLRTTFATVDGEGRQVIAPTWTLPLTVVDLAGQPPKTAAEELERAAAIEARRPFDLTRGPLLRATLFRLDEQDHRLLLTMHHIITDGWSIGVLRRELAQVYDAFASGNPSPLQPLPIQYADFAVWQRRWLSGPALQKELAYWKEQLANAPELLDLPTDYSRTPMPSLAGARQSLLLSAETTVRLQALARQEGVTLFMLLLAGFKTLLLRYSGQNDILVGAPVAGRTRAELEGLIGFFLNTLVFRTDLSGDPGFRQLLRRVREGALRAFAHQDVPFEKLVEELQPQRRPGRTPLFQVFFNLLNFETDDRELLEPQPKACLSTGSPDNSLASPSIKADSQFDLTLYAVPQARRLQLSLVYRTDLFADLTIANMLRRLETLLEEIVDHPEQRLSTIPLCRAPELGQSAANRLHPKEPFTLFPPEAIEQSIGRRFEEQAARQAANLAIGTAQHQWSYDELNQRANQVAHELLAQLGEGEQRVALLFEHDAPMVAALLGVLKAGKTYVPLEILFPRARLADMLSDAQISALVTNQAHSALARSLSESRLPIVNIDQLSASQHVGNVAISISPNRPAYILYTSGSSGQPKGVMQNHRNVLHHIRAYTNSLHIHLADRFTLLASYSFDAAVMDIFGALLNGAALYPLNLRDQSIDHVAKTLRHYGLTIFHSTPTVFRYFTDSLQESEKLTTVRLVVLGGEEVVARDVALFKRHFASTCVLVNGFGPTESTLALQYFLDHQSIVPRNTVPVGHPVAETEVLLLNESGEPVPDCGVGEIVIRSAYLAGGYWRRPELTAATFRPDPTDEQKCIYHTGDIGRRLPDGTLEFRGRKDFQVKIRGHRVETGEVETKLLDHPKVKQAVVVAVENGAAEKELSAYVVTVGDTGAPTARELWQFLKTLLPDYMVPASFVLLDALPLTSTGKVDRRALPAAHSNLVEREDAFMAPGSETELLLADLWSEVLGSSRVGIHDNFFEAGGHSLLATKLIVRVRTAFQVDLPLSALFSTPTVAGLAAAIDEARRSRGLVLLSPISALPRALFQAALCADGTLELPRALMSRLRAIGASGTFPSQNALPSL